MTEQTAQVSVRILDKEYQVACPASERTNLLDSAEILNQKMREIRRRHLWRMRNGSCRPCVKQYPTTRSLIDSRVGKA